MNRKSPLSTFYQQRYSLLLALCLLVAWSSAAWSHAHPEQMSPPPEATLKQAPTEVKIRFTADLESAFSAIKVTNEHGRLVNREPSYVETGKPRLLVAPLKPLEPGAYTVHWHVVALDGHTMEGDYKFEIVSAESQSQ